MTDIVDQAQELEQRMRDEALAHHRATHRVPRILGDGEQVIQPRDCGCGDPIPMDRLARNPFAERCVPCQARFEQHEKA
ncbi:MAG TPA: TraR/DksA C4-type zinc finger protein [Aliidongia sp.]|uniref:TraR/DksA C4-type zinc finger protein n=1 Tax=Aliidongia sp. TaxID=1914230 RepID=UPI002DDD3903|nr:TraR/DksA C4-type zinc finger protein [Aliidongia sp.]HEV2678088.1 TraR/DksA C4-type zinc finger protein [Aliidongia sp.]